MRTDADKREVQSTGVQAKGTFGISMRNQAHIMEILRDTLYSDKVLAVLREYGANAWDAHRMSEKASVPIKVTMPTAMTPTLCIRDFGKGLTEEEVFQVYTQYGESTKRDSDEGVGMLGIGSKSAFAYSDTYTVTSWCDGRKKIYVAVLDESNEGEINLLYEEDCGDETGIEVSVPVRPDDIPEFEEKARLLFPHFEPAPEINIEMPVLERTPLQGGYFNKGSCHGTGWKAIMGCIPYRINIDQIRQELEEMGVAIEVLHRTTGGLYFNIGEVQVSASREELKYGERTKKALAAKFHHLIETFTEDTLSALQAADTPEYEKRVRVLQLTRTMGLRIPDKYKEYNHQNVTLWTREDPPQCFYSGKERGAARNEAAISVTDGVLILDDDPRPMDGFRTGWGPIIVHPNSEAVTLDDVRAELATILEKTKMTGLPIRLLSTYPWYPPYVATPRAPVKRDVNKKHQVSTFRLIEKRNHVFPFSESWSIEEREPKDDDVFVVLESFHTTPGTSVGAEKFYDSLKADQELAKLLGLTLPTIYGYKTTMAKPVDPTKVKGTTYPEWRTKFFFNSLTPELQEKIQNFRWASTIRSGAYYHSFSRRDSVLVDKVLPLLGSDHLISKVLLGFRRGVRMVSGHASHNDELWERLLKLLKGSMTFEADLLMEQLKKYPLMLAYGGVRALVEDGDKMGMWIDYIKLIDRDHVAPVSSSTITDDTSDDTNIAANAEPIEEMSNEGSELHALP